MKKAIFISCVLLFLPSVLFSESAYVQGKDPKMDRYYDRNEEACLNDDRSYRYACFVAGEKYIYFNKGEMDKGIKYWGKSCKERGYGTACYFLAKVYINKQNGKFFSKNKALEAFDYGCRLGESNSINLGCKQGVEICCQDRI